MKTNVHLWSYFAQFFLERECFREKSYRKSENTVHIQLLLQKNRVVYDITWKNILAGQATDDNIALAHRMLYT